MLVNTHILVGQNVLKNMEPKKIILVSDKNFLYGAIKPDMVSKYKLKKHYLDESYDMVIKKIKALSSLTLDDISKRFPMSKFSQELGVICHFLCDFFCVPHSERWEFKHSMNKHIKYEKELAIVAKEYMPKGDKFKIFEKYDIEDFIKNLHKEYKKDMDYKNDLLFSNYICNSVMDFILDSIVYNTVCKKFKGIA